MLAASTGLQAEQNWCQVLPCAVGQKGGIAFGGRDDTWLRSAAV